MHGSIYDAVLWRVLVGSESVWGWKESASGMPPLGTSSFNLTSLPDYAWLSWRPLRPELDGNVGIGGAGSIQRYKVLQSALVGYIHTDLLWLPSGELTWKQKTTILFVGEPL